MAAPPSPRAVLLYVPNLIGYVRIMLALLLVGAHGVLGWRGVLGAYGFAAALDAVDGVLARALRQTSRFGEVLDVVADKCARPSPPPPRAAGRHLTPQPAIAKLCPHRNVAARGPSVP